MGHNKQHKGNPLTAKQLKDLKAKEEEQIKKAKAANEKNPQFGREEYKKMYGKYPTHEYGKKIPNAMNKQAYALKPVPEGNKGKGLSKLPEKVRNKMGYMMDSSHSFKSNVANNMKTMYMGSVYYQTGENGEDVDINKRVVVGPDGNLKTETTTTEKGFEIETYDAGDGKIKSAGTGVSYRQAFDKAGGEAKLGKTFEQFKKEAEEYNAKKYGREKGTQLQRKVPKDVEVKKLEDIPQSFQSTGNFGRRQQIRGVIQGERKAKRTAIRAARAAANKVGLKGKDRREFMRDQKGIAKGRQFENQSNRIEQINRQTAMQEAQGIIGPGGKIEQGFTPGTMKGNYDIRKDSRQTMNRGASNFTFKSGLNKDDIKIDKPKANLSLTSMKMDLPPKAMMYFNRKNKKK